MDIPPPPSASRPSWRWRILGGVVAVAVVAALVLTAYRLGDEGSSGFVEVPVGSGGGTDQVPADIEPLLELYDELDSRAVDAPESDELVEAAMEGMLDALDDPYARYYDPADYNAFSEELEGTYSGVGMELQETPDGLFVVTVFPDTPAEEAGVRAGDRIIGVDGEDVRDEPIESVVNDVRGEPGTDVTLELERDDGDEVLELDVTRAEIEIPRLDAELLDDEIAHLRLLQFTSGAGDDMRATAEELIAEGAEGFVLDLRGNPGGLLREAVSAASVFLDDEVVVRVQERESEEEVLEARGDPVEQLPLVVLVDQHTASASEIVAGAVQDADRGTVVGEPTFGKGTVQSIRSLSDGSGVKFTTAAYYTPSGDSIEEVGVQPDRVVERDEDDDEDEQLAAARDELRSLMAEAGN